MDNLDTKAKAINKTWTQDCDKYVFVVKPKYYDLKIGMLVYDENYLPLLYLPHYEESYEKLTDKIYQCFVYIYLNYDNYGWYVKADDDTFMLIDNLKSFLADKDPHLPITYGLRLHMDDIESGYLQGGAGYVLSNAALKKIGLKLLNNDSFCPNSGKEDIDVAKCLRKLSVYAGKSIDDKERERFQAFGLKAIQTGNYPEWYYGQSQNSFRKGLDAFSDTTISFHEMTPKNMIIFYSFWKHSKKSSSISFGQLVDQFLSNY